jgi:hypothetical protein
MEIVCPSCGKANQADPCSRCGCELSPLFAIYHAAEAEVRIATKCLRCGSLEEARGHAMRSWELHQNPKAARLVFFASLGLNDFAGASHWQGMATTLEQRYHGLKAS